MSETNLTETLFIEELYLFIKQCSANQPKSIEIALLIYFKNIVVHPDGEICKCGKRGCLQTYTSESWIIKKSQILFDNSDSTYLRQLAADRSHLTIETILQAYKLGDEGVTNILHNAIKYLSITLNNLSMMIAMDKMVIHGELFTETQLANLIKDYLENNSTLLATEKKIHIEFKPYLPINGAVSAAGLCVIKQLLS